MRNPPAGCTRHEPLQLMTASQNLKYNKKLKRKLNKRGCDGYPQYDNYDAFELSFTECIPSDYDGIMDVYPSRLWTSTAHNRAKGNR